MKIGRMNAPSSGLRWESTACRAGTAIPFPPKKLDNGNFQWFWTGTMGTGVDLRITFEKEVFVSVIRLPLAGASALAQVGPATVTRRAAAVLVGAFGIYLAAQCFAGIIL